MNCVGPLLTHAQNAPDLRELPRKPGQLGLFNRKMIIRGPRRRLQPSRGMADLREQIDVTHVTPACARPTSQYPQGRTGTDAGVAAHRNAGEAVCETCAAARRLRRAEQKAKASPCFAPTADHPNGRKGTLAGYKAHVQARQRPCPECRKAAVPEPGLACALPTIEHPDGRTGTCAGYQVHRYQGEEACEPCLTAHSARSLEHLHGLSGEARERYLARNNAAAKKWRTENPEAQRAAKHKVIDRNRAAVLEAKDKPCADCGIHYPYYVMEFDHLDSGVKEFNISAGVTCASYERLISEIAKCEVVCANCHAERTYQRRESRRRSRAESS